MKTEYISNGRFKMTFNIIFLYRFGSSRDKVQEVIACGTDTGTLSSRGATSRQETFREEEKKVQEIQEALKPTKT